MPPSIDTAPPDRTRPAAWALLLALLALGTLLRLHVARTAPVHDDEIWSMMLSTGRGSVHLTAPRDTLLPHLSPTTALAAAPGFLHVPTTLRDVTHPPGYYTTLGLYRTLTAALPVSPDLAARSLSILASAAMLYLWFLAVRRWAGTEPALWVTAVLAIARPFVELTAMARPYAVELMYAGLAAYALARLSCPTPKDRRPVSLALLSLGTLGLASSHYFSAGTVLALAVVAAFAPPPGYRRAAVAAVLIPAGLFALAWSPFLLEQSRAGRLDLTDPATRFLQDDPARPLPARVLTAAGRAVEAPGKFLIPIGPPTAWVQYTVAVALAGAVALAWRSSPRRHLTALLLLALGGLLAPLALDLLRSSSHLQFTRYVVLLLPPAVALAALPTRQNRWLSRLPIALLALTAVASLLPTFAVPPPDARPWAAAVDAALTPTDVLVFATSLDAPAVAPTSFLLFSHLRHTDPPLLLTSGPVPQPSLAGRPLLVVALPDDPVLRAFLPTHTFEASTRLDPEPSLWRFAPKP